MPVERIREHSISIKKKEKKYQQFCNVSAKDTQPESNNDQTNKSRLGDNWTV
jgi:hypothetical protein